MKGTVGGRLRGAALALTVVMAGLPPGIARAQGTPTAPIAALDAALLASMRAGGSMTYDARAATLAPVIEAAFDLPAILAVSVGPQYATMPDAQKAQLLQAFRAYTVASYAANFNSYDGERFDLAPQTRAVGADQVVDTTIVTRDGGTRIDYVMRQTPAGWRAVDVLLDGSISRVAVQRSDFRSLLSSGGAAALAASLQRKTSQLAAGEAPKTGVRTNP